MILPFVNKHSQVLSVGIGCKKNTSASLIESAIRQVFNRHNLDLSAIALLVTIDGKKNEVGILQLAEKWNLPLKTFTVEELEEVEIPNPSSIVEKKTGTKSVAEACAMKGSLWSNLGDNRITELIIPKQIINDSKGKGAVNIAVARFHFKDSATQKFLELIDTNLLI